MNLKTFEWHILEDPRNQQRPATDRRDLHGVLSGIVHACKIIAQEVRRIGLSECHGAGGSVNVHGERQTGLDVLANEVLAECLAAHGNVALIASEENEHPVLLTHAQAADGFIVVFDPLDGSSNIDVNVNVGTIYSVYRRTDASAAPVSTEVLQPGALQVAAGYVLYGPSTVLVSTIGQGVHGFTLDPATGAFVLTHPDLCMPTRGSHYSVNESYVDAFPPHCRRFLHWLKSGADDEIYKARYVGSLVADFHRTLLKGGIFLYPPTSLFPEGKLRLMYEANPIAFLADQAGGYATDGSQPILAIEPCSLHQRVPLYVGSQWEMERLEAFVRKPLMV